MVRGDLPEGGGAGLLNLGVRREIFKREDVVSRKAQHGFCRERAGELAGGEDGGVQRFGGLVVGNDDDARRSGGTDEVRKVKGAGRGGESGDTSAPRTAAQVAAYTLKGFGVLEVRKQLADEG
jgi:hypothetical protein